MAKENLVLCGQRESLDKNVAGGNRSDFLELVMLLASTFLGLYILIVDSVGAPNFFSVCLSVASSNQINVDEGDLLVPHS